LDKRTTELSKKIKPVFITNKGKFDE